MRRPYVGDLPDNLRDHLAEDIKAVIRTLDQFLEHELPNGAVSNLQATRKELSRAWASTMAAALTAEEVNFLSAF